MTTVLSMSSCLPLLLCAFAVVAPAIPRQASAQVTGVQPGAAAPGGRYELTGIFGWATSSDVHGGGRTLSIGDATSYGASLGFHTPHGTLVELRWLYYNTEATLQGAGLNSKFHVPTNYFLLGGQKGFRRPQTRVEPFIDGSLGVVTYSPAPFDAASVHYSPSTTVRFAFALGGGLKLHLSQRLALRFGAEMLAPVLFSGGGFYVGTGGASVGVSGGIPTVTGNFTVGLVFRP
jgi:hypothetical protein